MPSASAATCRVCGPSTRYCAAMFSTLARRTSSNSGSVRAARPSSRSKNTPSRSPASVVSIASAPAARSASRTTTAPAEDQVGARGLDAGHARPLGRGQRRRAARSAPRAPRRAITVPCTPLRRQPGRALGGRREVADRAADADEADRRLRRASARATATPHELARDVLAQLAQLPALGRPVRRQEALAHPHGAERPGARVAAPARPATRTSCSEPPPRSSTQPSASVVELTAAR